MMKKLIVILLSTITLSGCANYTMGKCKDQQGSVVDRNFQPASAAGYGHQDIEWGYIYVTTTGYTFKSQKFYEVGSDIETIRTCIIPINN